MRSDMVWDPKSGTLDLVGRVGGPAALRRLTKLLLGEVAGPHLTDPAWRAILLDIGDGHAERLMHDPSGERLNHWPRVWAARSMAYLGDQRAGPALLAAIQDEHWRVRMTATQSLGRLRVAGVTAQLVDRLEDPHERVREAARLALARVGDPGAIEPLIRARDCGRVSRDGAERAMEEIAARS